MELIPLEQAGSLDEQKQLVQLTDKIVDMVTGLPLGLAKSAVFSAMLSIEKHAHGHDCYEAARRIALMFETLAAKQHRTN